MKQSIRTSTLTASLLLTPATSAFAHSDRGEKRPETYSEAVIPMTKQEFRQKPLFRHPLGNMCGEDMHALFTGNIIVVDAGREQSDVPGLVNHALKVIINGKDGRYVSCAFGFAPDYYHQNDKWAPTKFSHANSDQHFFDPAIENDCRGLSRLYDGDAGQIVRYHHRDHRWHPRDVGHVQERLPRTVCTLCPEFPSPEELGVGFNEVQTAFTYDKLLAKDSERRILRPDLITRNPAVVIE